MPDYLAGGTAVTKLLFEYTTDELATKFNDAEAAVAASYFNQGDYVGLTDGAIASIFDNANLTAAKAASIMDNANITSAKIKAILDTGSLTVADKIAALLDGDSLTAADAATHVNSGTYTDDLMASAFDSSYLAAAKAASIMDNANLTAAKAASIFNNTNLTLSKAASIFEDTNLTISKINSIITNDNISDSRAQEILNETDYATRDLTGAASILYAIHDDWADNKLTSRDNRATTAASVLGANEFAQKFRPEWDTTNINTKISVETGYLKIVTSTDYDKYIKITDNITEGTWKMKQKLGEVNSSGGWNYTLAFMFTDTDNFYAAFISGFDEYVRFSKFVTGSNTHLIEGSITRDTDWHEVKITRDSSGNFELFYDGTSKGTVTDTSFTSGDLVIGQFKEQNNEDVYVDDLEVY